MSVENKDFFTHFTKTSKNSFVHMTTTAAAAASQLRTSIVGQSDHGGGVQAAHSSQSVKRLHAKSEKVVNEMKKVIFPDGRWIKIWDTIIIVLLVGIAFITPYQLGVSGGVYLITELWWLIVNVIINTFFFFDTFLYFWRAYRDQEGRLVFNLRRIRRRYLKTYFFLNVLGCFPATLIFYFVVKSNLKKNGVHGHTVVLIKLLDLLKLFRFIRVNTILKASSVITQLRQNTSSQYLELIKYTSLLVMVSHWFACTWAFVAFAEARGLDEDSLSSTPNWIGNWYENNYIEGGLNPMGWFQDMDRYVLSLFWAIQTITSIGYGNIAPVTPAEWWVGCILMLVAGIMWAYMIGGLVGVTAAMNARGEIYRERIDQANAMIKEFDTGDMVEGSGPDMKAAEEARDLEIRIKNYIHNQHTTSNHTVCVSDLSQTFPVLETLSPDLQRMSAFMVLKDDLETVPYLSSRFLSITARSEVAVECVFLEFAAGEVIDIERGVGDLGRGIFVIRKGIGFLRMQYSSELAELLLPSMTCGDGRVLVEDGHPVIKGYLHFMSFAKVLFIPRRAVLAALAKNPTAWKECARWKYFIAVLSGRRMEKESAEMMEKEQSAP
jgi:hypothetical protein